MDWTNVRSLAIAVGLGLLVGMEREWSGRHLAGIRTFPLLTGFGALVGLLSLELGPEFAAAGIVVAGAMVVAGYVVRSREPTHGTGLTTAVAALVLSAAGLAIGRGHIGAGLFVGGSAAVLLQWKSPLHRVVERIGANDIRAVSRMVLIALIVLPVLPDRTFGPYGVVNPFEIWLVVVLICGISLGSYLAYRYFGSRTGTVLGGLLGGLISSTATTVSHARTGRQSPELASQAALVIVIASTVMYVRVMVEIAVVAPAVLPGVAPQLCVITALLVIITVVLWLRTSKTEANRADPSDPLQIKSAILFGLLFLLVLLAVAVAKEHLGDEALYAVAAISGLTDVDAITLSTARMVEKGRLDLDVGWRMIMIGAMANLVLKGAAVAVLGGRRVFRPVATAFGATLACAALLLWLWP